MRISWRDRLSDPWFVLPICVLAGAVLALSLAIALEPDDPSPAATAADGASPEEGAAERDAVRRADLFYVRFALVDHYREVGSYPSTGGELQPLCDDQDGDAGCALVDYFDPLPADPLGDGYWYESDGQRYVLYARMETADGIDETTCPAPRPEPFEGAVAMLCVPGGPPAE